MLTIGKIVEDELKKYPFLEEALAEELVNLSAFARKLKPVVESRLGRPVNEGAIIMAVKRMPLPLHLPVNHILRKFLSNMGEMTVRSDITDFTFANSPTLTACQGRLLEALNKFKDAVFSFSKGVNETTIVISSSLDSIVEDMFKTENLILKQTNLSTITLKLHMQNSRVIGLYYHIFKQLAWEGINIVEVISTTNEFTIIVGEDFVDKAFSILKRLKAPGME